MHILQRGIKATVFLSLVLALAGCVGIERLPDPIKDYLTPIELVSAQAAALHAFQDYPNGKGFAVSKFGNSGSGYLGENSGGARSALISCQINSAHPCRLHQVNNEKFQHRYAEYAQRSAEALAGLRPVSKSDYDLEGADWQVPAPTGLKSGKSYTYGGNTPLSLNGIKTIKTHELVRMLIDGAPTMIDAQGWVENLPMTIPAAYLVDWAGTEETDLPGYEAKIRKEFEVVMQLIEPVKSKPVVVFCESARCWLSINAALRLQTLGYSNIYWYRGGVAAWKAAGLPTLSSVPHATIWVNK